MPADRARTFASAPSAQRARDLVESLQSRLVAALESAAQSVGDDTAFEATHWLRDEGRHGGGMRMGTADTKVFNRASVNVSQVHYDDLPDKRLASATALSAIVHPAAPRAPSVHMHISWTHLRDGSGYWRMMADLNPSNPVAEDKASFAAALEAVVPEHYAYAAQQGDRYFDVPALGRTRGVTHFYLEGYKSDDPEADLALAERFGVAAIDAYKAVLTRALGREPLDSAAADKQLAYHTLYAFQVLTLDRGTTSGLLVHDQNDVGTLGSLPARLDARLMASWIDEVPEAQAPLVRAIAERLAASANERGVCVVDDAVKQALADIVRDFYRANPAALELQARGDVVPPTVANHRAPAS